MTEQAAPAERPPLFHERASSEASTFSQFLINNIPELESVAIVFSFAVNAPELPVAIVRGINGQLKSPVEIIHMCTQLARVWQAQMQTGSQCIQILDQHMADQAKKLKSLQDQIKQLEGQLDAAKQPVKGSEPT